MNEDLTKEQSLSVINSMIAQARGNLVKGAGKYFLLWGYLMAAASIAHFVVLAGLFGIEAGPYASAWIWAVAVAAGIVPCAVMMTREKRKPVTTYADTVIGTVWIAFALCAFSVPWLIGGNFAIYPIITLLYTFALAVSARAYRFRWMMAPVVVTALCVVAYKLVPVEYYPLLMALTMVSGNIVPGHILNRKAKRYV